MRERKTFLLLLLLMAVAMSMPGAAEDARPALILPTEIAGAPADSARLGSREHPVPTGEAFVFETEVLPNGTPRMGDEMEYQTLRISMTLLNYLTPDYFAKKYTRQFKLKGTEAGAEISLALETGNREWIAQDIVGFTLENAAGAVNRGYQLMDAEIAGGYDVALRPGEAATFYKRFVYSEEEDMRYLVASFWQGGEEQKVYFQLEALIDYPTLSRGSRGEDVRLMQEWLAGLGYLDDVADGIFGKNTEAAVIAAQGAWNLEASGVADTPFQRILFKQELPEPADGGLE